jgi:orotate phosphoribosyltransferase
MTSEIGAPATSPAGHEAEASSGPVISLVRWEPVGLTPDAARTLAAETTAAFGRIPGLLELRFYGDFDTGVHYYHQVWRDRAALDAYMASEGMLRIRDLAAPYVGARPTREILVDYSARAAAGPGEPVDLEALGRDLVTASLLRGDFVLSSGARSDYYLDKYRFETRPDLLRRIAAALGSLLPGDVDRIAGPELGAVALAAAVSLATGRPFVIVRKAAKGYSTERIVEGELEPGDRIVLVEDVLTTGAQAIRAAERLREAGATVVAIVGVVDREEGAAAACDAAGIELRSVFSRSALGI